MNTLFLETKRLLLKFPTPDDLTSLLQLRTNPEVMRYIGDGSVQTIEKVYGSGSEWQKAMTFHWLRRIQQHDADKEMVILEGQINLDFIVAACKGWGIHDYHIVLVHCDDAVRHQRLAQLRQQPELIHQEMDHWTQYLRQQALAHQALILDSGKLSVQEMATKIKRFRYS